MRLNLLITLVFPVLSAVAGALAQTAPVSVVAAENVYGDIAEQLGGDAVKVVSLINNPAQDPHLFEASPATARALAGALIVIANGADYDAWLDKLLQASPRSGRVAIDVAKLMGRKAGDNPHLWYDPATMPAFAKALAAALEKADPGHATDYKSRLEAVLASLKPIGERVAAMRAKYKGQPVTATEPVFGPMLDAIGLVSRNQRFQLAMMNDTEPSAQDLAAFETDLKQRKVKALINNTKVSETLSQRLTAIAKAANVPVVGITETLPPGRHFQDWVLAELYALDKALSGAK